MICAAKELPEVCCQEYLTSTWSCGARVGINMINEVAVCQYAGETTVYFENTFYLVSHRIAQQTQVEQVQYTGARKKHLSQYIGTESCVSLYHMVLK